MRKFIVFVLIVGILGGYSAYWYKKAREFQQMVEQSIVNINDEAKALSNDTTLIRYESMQISGFPFSMTMEVIKPVVDIPVSALMLKMPQPAGAPPLTPPATPTDWIEEISYGESVSFSGNITGNHFTLKASGDRTHKTLINHIQHGTLVGSSATPFVCHLKVEQDSGAPWTMRPVFTDLQTFLAIFRAGDCDVSGLTLKNASNGATLFTADALSFTASNEPAGVVNRKIIFQSEYKNAKATPAFDAVANDYAQLSRTVMGQTGPAPAFMPLSEYGTVNSKADIRYEGPTTAAGMADFNAQMRLDVNALDIKDALGEQTAEAHISSIPQKDERTASVVIHASSEAVERFDQLLVQDVADIIAQLEQTPAKTPDDAQIAQNLPQIGTPQVIAQQITPQFHSFGKMTIDVDASLKGPNQPAAFKQGVYTLKALDWASTPYAIRQKGSADLSVKNKAPTGELVLTCTNCDALISDAGDYAMRVDGVISRARQKPLHVTKDLVESVRQFVHGIAENTADKNAKDVVIHLQANPQGITISGKQILEVIGLYSSTIAAHLPANQPPAGAMSPMPVMPAKPAP